MIPYGRQEITESDIQAVLQVLKSDWLTQGPAIPAFEKSVADYCGVGHAVAFCNATAALHGACFALGLKAGDTLWTSPNTFVASANCALYCGASVDFVDIDPRTWNMSVEALSAKLEIAEKQGRLPRVVVPVHFSGQPCDMKEIRRLADHYGFSIIEDAAHAIGGRYENEPVGSCRYSDITVFSFHPVKIITTAEGGLATTRNSELADKMARFRTHGITRSPSQMVDASEGPWYYQQIELGFNYRMTDLQAALGSSQMVRLDDYVERRNALAERYHHLLEALPIQRPWLAEGRRSAWHLYCVRVQNRKAVFESLREQGIGVNVHYIPVHTQPYYRGLGFQKGQFPLAERYYEEAISLPLYATLSHEDQDTVVCALKKALVCS